MPSSTPLAGVVAAALLLFAGATAAAGERDIYREARAPLGLQLFCLQNPQDCRGGGASQVRVTPAVLGLLQKVNARVNRTIVPRRDKGTDVWTADARYGDCEDYVLAKRRQLIAAGLPGAALRIALVKTRRGEAHALLVVRTDQGELALDNLTNQIKPLGRTGHRLVRMSGANPAAWS